MIGLDTNVVVRYLTQDDPKQSSIATRFLENELTREEPGFISLVVLAEIVWVLVSLYAVDRGGVAEILAGLLTTEQLRLESTDLVWRAKRRYEESKAEFSDALIMECTLAAACEQAVTFDKAAASTAGLDLLT